jgi:hypothetical protein
MAASAARTDNVILIALDNCMERSRRSTARNNDLTRENTTKIYHRSLQRTRQPASSIKIMRIFCRVS